MTASSQLLGISTYERMKAMILDGTLTPGAALREKEFADLLGVSRTPVREAIGHLVSNGFAKRTSAGTPVVNSASLTDIMEILHARSLLECEAARKAALSQANADDFADLRVEIEGSVKGAYPDVGRQEALDLQVHLAVAHRAGSRLLAELIEGLNVRARLYDRGSIPDRFAAVCREHLAIIDAILAGTPDVAAEAMRLHLKKARDAIISDIDHPF